VPDSFQCKVAVPVKCGGIFDNASTTKFTAGSHKEMIFNIIRTWLS